MASSKTGIVWFRRDLRLADNPALSRGVAECDRLVLVYIHSPSEEHPWEIGAASKWWLHFSLLALSAEVAARGGVLEIRQGETASVLQQLIAESGATALYWNRLYDPKVIERDTRIKTLFREQGVEVESCPGSLLFEPWEIKTGSGTPYQVFTPFWRKLSSEFILGPLTKAPSAFQSVRLKPSGTSVESLQLLPSIDWAAGFRERWTPGERGAQLLVKKFLSAPISKYADARNLPAVDGSSSLSPHLHFGEISPRLIWAEAQKRINKGQLAEREAEPFLRQLGWRDFAHHLLFHFPHTDLQPLREDFRRFPWKSDKTLLRAWQRGRTGYPMVDAGMRELWHTGTMHNRVRMIVASFLVKHLLQPWQDGASWFWDTLVDADLANNSLGWQWTAGCGADAAPYFRIFNPISQGSKFDPQGEYVRRWVPELAKVPTKYLFSPWEAPAAMLTQAGVVIGVTYPAPIVDHREGRESALEAYEDMKALRSR